MVFEVHYNAVTSWKEYFVIEVTLRRDEHHIPRQGVTIRFFANRGAEMVSRNLDSSC